MTGEGSHLVLFTEAVVAVERIGDREGGLVFADESFLDKDFIRRLGGWLNELTVDPSTMSPSAFKEASVGRQQGFGPFDDSSKGLSFPEFSHNGANLHEHHVL